MGWKIGIKSIAYAAIILLVLLLIYVSCIIYSTKKSKLSGLPPSIYLDNNATTIPYPEVLQTMAANSILGNESAPYATEAKQVIQTADQVIREVAHAPPCYSCIYTSGGSESNNLFLRGLVDAYWQEKSNNTDTLLPHLILSGTEHKTSMECAKQLASLGRADVTFVEPRIDGTIDPLNVAYALQPNTIGVSIIHTHNETGGINNVEEIGRIIRIADPNICYHIDAVQSFGKIPVSVWDWYADAISVSFHKLYGPTGVGVLIASGKLCNKLKLAPQISGSQNSDIRGGTMNIAGIAGSTLALQMTQHNRVKKNQQLLNCKRLFLTTLLKRCTLGSYNKYYNKPDNYSDASNSTRQIELIILGPTKLTDVAPGTLLISFVRCAPVKDHLCNIKMQNDLKERGVLIALGSACSSSASILKAIKAPYIVRCGTIRVSFGDYNTSTEAITAAQKVIECLELQL